MSRHSSFSRSSAPRPWRSPSKPTDAQPTLSLVFAEPQHAIPVSSTAATNKPSFSDADGKAHSPLPRLERPDAASSLRRTSYASLNNAASGPAGPAEPPSAEPANVLGDSAGAVKGSPSSDATGSESRPTPTVLPKYENAGQQNFYRAGWFGSVVRKPRTSQLREESPRLVEATIPSLTNTALLEPQGIFPDHVPGTSLDPPQSQRECIPFPASAVEPIFKAPEAKSKPPDLGRSSKRDASPVMPEYGHLSSEASRPVLSVSSYGPSSSYDTPQKKPAGRFASESSSASKCSVQLPDTIVSSSIDDNVPPCSSFSAPTLVPPVRPREKNISDLSSLNPSSSRFILSIPVFGRPKITLDQAITEAERGRGADEDSQMVKAPTLSQIEKHEKLQACNETPRERVLTWTDQWLNYLGFTSLNSHGLTPHLDTSPSTAALNCLVTSDSSSGADAPDPATKPRESVPPVESSLMSSQYPSTWYTPWRWYGDSPLPASQEVTDTTETNGGLVNDDVLAHLEPTSSASLPLQTKPSNPGPNSYENRASWIAFLSPLNWSSVNAKNVRKKDDATASIELNREDLVSVESRASSLRPASVKNLPPSPTHNSFQEPVKLSLVAQSSTKDDLFRNLNVLQRTGSLSSKKSVLSAAPPRANLLLPTFEDTFDAPPRSIFVTRSPSTIRRTIRFVSELLCPEEDQHRKGKGVDDKTATGWDLPRTWAVLGDHKQAMLGGLKGVNRIVVIGIHGWFPGSIIRQVLGEPTGTSLKFANMLASAVEEYFAKHGGKLDKLTKIVLEGEGTIERRVNALYQEYLSHEDWVEDLQKADAILLATHSQGSIVSTQLLCRMIREGHIRTRKSITDNHETAKYPGRSVVGPQRVCCVAMCGIHLGPLLYLNTSSLVNPYIQYFESAAARELFEFQDSESPVSQTYVKALRDVLDHGVKFTYVASLNDQVVPVYSGCFSTAAHPLILRALYIDGEVYNSSDFLSNLLVLLLRIRNAGLDDGGLISHLSEATAGSLSGVGHSAAYEEPATYALTVRFLFETSDALSDHPELDVQPFTARAARNDYEIPWILRDLIANPDVASMFSAEFSSLQGAFDDWHPRTTALRQIRQKLEPIRRLRMARL